MCEGRRGRPPQLRAPRQGRAENLRQSQLFTPHLTRTVLICPPPYPFPTPALGCMLHLETGSPAVLDPQGGTLAPLLLQPTAKMTNPCAASGRKCMCLPPAQAGAVLLLQEPWEGSPVHQTRCPPDEQTLNNPLCMIPSYSTSISDSLHWKKGNKDGICLKLIGNTVLSDEILETFSLNQGIKYPLPPVSFAVV